MVDVHGRVGAPAFVYPVHKGFERLAFCTGIMCPTVALRVIRWTGGVVRGLLNPGPRLGRNALPVVIGGDHSINIPCVAAFSDHGRLHLVQIDAHLDFVDERHGVRYGHGNPMRRAAERDYVTGLSQFGIRNVSSTAKEGYDAAREMGADILSVHQIRKLGIEAVLKRVPTSIDYYLSIDIDGFDPSIAPGTGTPSHGGFLYYEVLELLAGLTKRGRIEGLDLVEVSPRSRLCRRYVNSGSTDTAQRDWQDNQGQKEINDDAAYF